MDQDSGCQKFMRVYRDGEIIFEEGEGGAEMYVVYSGKVRLYRVLEDAEVELAVVEAGQFFGEMALVDDSPRSAGARATGDHTKLIALDKDKFLFMVSHQPAFALTIMRALCQVIRGLTGVHYSSDEQPVG